MSESWVDGFIDKVQATVDNGGEVTVRDPKTASDILVTIGQDLLQFLVANRMRLAQVSYESFQNYLGKMSQGEDFDALVLIYSEVDTALLVDKYKEDTIKLAEIAKQVQEHRDFWISFAKQAAQRIVFSALGALL